MAVWVKALRKQIISSIISSDLEAASQSQSGIFMFVFRGADKRFDRKAIYFCQGYLKFTVCNTFTPM